MFDPILRVKKSSQLLFVSAVLLLSSPIYASESGPLVDAASETIAPPIVLDLDKASEVIIEPVVMRPSNDGSESAESAPKAESGPELVAPLVPNVKVITNQTSSETKPTAPTQPLGPMLYQPKPVTVQKQNLFPSFPAYNATSDNEEKSLDFLWQKTFPTKKTLEQETKLVETEAGTVINDETSVVDDRPTITIIIDDLGYNRRGMEESLSLPVEVTLAILPHTPFSKKTALAATEQARTIMLHVPMENERELKLGPGGLYRDMKEAELKKTLKDGIESVPGISGINNHMGSLLTQDVEKMEWVMEVIQPMELFFVDSLTSPNSVALSKAVNFNLTTTIRDVFLDNVQEEKAIDRQFKRLLAIARKRGKALAIGHPYPSTMSYLSKRLVELEDEGIRLVSIAEYVK